jgi:hypothetical protein
LSTTTEHHLILCPVSTTSPPRRPPVPAAAQKHDDRAPLDEPTTRPHATRRRQTTSLPRPRHGQRHPRSSSRHRRPRRPPSPRASATDRPKTHQIWPRKPAGKTTSCTCRRLRRPHGQNHRAPLAAQLQGARTLPPSSGAAAPAFQLCCVGGAARGPVTLQDARPVATAASASGSGRGRDP